MVVLVSMKHQLSFWAFGQCSIKFELRCCCLVPSPSLRLNCVHLRDRTDECELTCWPPFCLPELLQPNWIVATIDNSLTAIGARERQLFNKLRGTVVSLQIFICSQSLIACWMHNDLILAAVACDLYKACSINDVSRGSKSYLFCAS